MPDCAAALRGRARQRHCWRDRPQEPETAPHDRRSQRAAGYWVRAVDRYSVHCKRGRRILSGCSRAPTTPQADASSWVTTRTIFASTPSPIVFSSVTAKAALRSLILRTGPKLPILPPAAHLEAFQIDRATGRLYANVPDGRHIAVVDIASSRQIGSWTPAVSALNFPMVFDEASSQIVVGTRRPSRLIALASDGASAALLDICDDTDDVFLDTKRRRFLATVSWCSEGISGYRLAVATRGLHGLAGIPDDFRGTHFCFSIPRWTGCLSPFARLRGNRLQSGFIVPPLESEAGNDRQNAFQTSRVVVR